MSHQAGAESADNSSIVLRVLEARSHESGDSFTAVVRIGKPYWVEEGIEAACPLTLDGLYGREPDIRGVDPLDALRNAILLADRLLAGSLDEYDLYWPGGEPFEPVDEWPKGSASN